jgi:hypothetical protein
MLAKQEQISDFLASHGGPFYELQGRLGLKALKQRALLLLGAQATRYHRAAERKLLGQNVVADADGEQEEDIADPTKVFDTTRKLSTMLVARTAIVPVTAAALIPFAIAGASWLPYKEVFSVLKKLLLI